LAPYLSAALRSVTFGQVTMLRIPQILGAAYPNVSLHILGLFDYRIRIRIHSESRFRFTWQMEWLRRV